MIHATPSQLIAQFANEVGIRRFTVDEYHRLSSCGVLDESDRVELLNGVISPKMIHSHLHDATVCIIEELIRNRLSPGWTIRVQCAITLSHSEPEPDIAVVAGPVTRYLQEHPSQNDIKLIIEVAESSLARDRLKATIYAEANVPCYWIVNLTEKVVEVYSEPLDGVYNRRLIYSSNDFVPVVIGEFESEPADVSKVFYK
jgi:Uma2 family endonuclease